MTTPRDPIYAGYRYPPEIICHAVWLYFRYPLSLRMVEELLAARGIEVSYETVRQWGLKFGEVFARRILQRAPQRGDNMASRRSRDHHRRAQTLIVARGWPAGLSSRRPCSLARLIHRTGVIMLANVA